MSKTFCELVNCPDSMKNDLWNNTNVVWTLKDNMCVVSSPIFGFEKSNRYPCCYLTKNGTLRKRRLSTYEGIVDKSETENEYKRDGIVLISAYLKWKNGQKSERTKRIKH